MSKQESKSLFGKDLRHYTESFSPHAQSAYKALTYLITNGGTHREQYAELSLAAFDLEIYHALSQHHEIEISRLAVRNQDTELLKVYYNSLGRVHIRLEHAAEIIYDDVDDNTMLGYIQLPQSLYEQAQTNVQEIVAAEERAVAQLRLELSKLDEANQLDNALSQCIDHVKHVESVCFYVSDKFYTLIDRHNNLVTEKSRIGYLNKLAECPLSSWDDNAVVIVSALHALFLSGRAVRFEEFNGVVLSALSLYGKLNHLVEMYYNVNNKLDEPLSDEIFTLAQQIRQLTLQSPNQSWLRYRWIYGLHFFKTEHIVENTRPHESSRVILKEFGGVYRMLVGKKMSLPFDEYAVFKDLSQAALEKALKGDKVPYETYAANNWFEYLLQMIVTSAVKASHSDYGMTSTIRNLGQLCVGCRSEIVEKIGDYSNKDFFTCWVANNMQAVLPEKTVDVIASSCQKRMMFNRWHFIPGNLQRHEIRSDRHWYYPPLIPDIAEHSDVHREAHHRAAVKYSIRSPGPDMSKPSFIVNGIAYRGFYDVRTVRMDGKPYDIEDMLRVRRRTLWLSAFMDSWREHLMSLDDPTKGFQFTGFEPGNYYDTSFDHGYLLTGLKEA